jgi:molybdopterin-binding protein
LLEHDLFPKTAAHFSGSCSNEAVAELKLEAGKQAYAVIKATDVMVGID